VSENVGARQALPKNEIFKQRARHALPLHFWLIAFFVVALDQLSKLWIRQSFAVGETQPLLENWMHFTYSQNKGAAWGMLSGQRFFLIFVSIAVAGFILYMAREFAREGAKGVLPLYALGLIFGGAIGNLIDRIYFGFVTDFFDLETPIRYLQTFPIFNIADSALTVGVLLLMLHFLLHRETESQTSIANTNFNAPDSL